MLMTVTWASMQEDTHMTIETINHVFSVLFVVEIAMKLIVFKCRFFKDNWNIFDFFIVVFPFLIGIIA